MIFLLYVCSIMWFILLICSIIEETKIGQKIADYFINKILK